MKRKMLNKLIKNTGNAIVILFDINSMIKVECLLLCCVKFESLLFCNDK